MLLIAGIDSGVNFALALVNLKGDLIYLRSGKTIEEKALETCLENGKVIAVTTDKKESRKAKKMASALSAVLLLPKKDLSRQKKLGLTRIFRDRKMDSHERSALASALFAWKIYRQKLKKFEDETKISDLERQEEFILVGGRINRFK